MRPRLGNRGSPPICKSLPCRDFGSDLQAVAVVRSLRPRNEAFLYLCCQSAILVGRGKRAFSTTAGLLDSTGAVARAEAGGRAAYTTVACRLGAS